MVNLIENLLEVLGLDSLHVLVELALLLFRQAREIRALCICNCNWICLGVSVIWLCHLHNLLLFLTFEVLIYSVLHRIDAFFQPRVPVVFNSVVSSTHELLGNETPLLRTLVSEDEKHPLLFLRPFCSFDFRVQVVEPAFAARFATSSTESFGEVSPHHVFVSLSLIVDVSEDGFILLWGPVSNWVGGWFL